MKKETGSQELFPVIGSQHLLSTMELQAHLLFSIPGFLFPC